MHACARTNRWLLLHARDWGCWVYMAWGHVSRVCILRYLLHFLSLTLTVCGVLHPINSTENLIEPQRISIRLSYRYYKKLSTKPASDTQWVVASPLFTCVWMCFVLFGGVPFIVRYDPVESLSQMDNSVGHGHGFVYRHQSINQSITSHSLY